MFTPCENGNQIDANGYWCIQVFPGSFYLKYACDSNGSFTALICPNDCISGCRADPVTFGLLNLNVYDTRLNGGMCIPGATLPLLANATQMVCRQCN
jgi:hypothetical protein